MEGGIDRWMGRLIKHIPNDSHVTMNMHYSAWTITVGVVMFAALSGPLEEGSQRVRNVCRPLGCLNGLEMHPEQNYRFCSLAEQERVIPQWNGIDEHGPLTS
ncbi:hypothetical protein CRENBAI_022852 [Crenichthys baileyi]|uniref:Uncharacterized protein n=1 Tax=Crenichthys baileyi TaxID=28760 RepID=A0AAV9RPW6_9TELE